MSEPARQQQQQESNFDYPPETVHHLSWTAIHFIHAPSSRMFFLTALVLIAVSLGSVFLTHFIEMDVTIDGGGEILSDTGVREAISPTSGLITEVMIRPGDQVQEGDVLARLALNGSTEMDLKDIESKLKQLIRDLEESKVPSSFSGVRLLAAKIQDVGLLQSLAEVERGLSAIEDHRRHTRSGLVREIEGPQKRLSLLQKKLAQMNRSKNRNILGIYIEQTEEEIGRLRAQVSNLQNSSRTKNEQLTADLVKSSRLALAETEGFLKKHLVLSPIDGTVGKVMIGSNTHVPSGKGIAVLLPKASRMVAAIEIPSKDIAQVQTQQKVWLKVEAYPYQQFGLFSGKILSFDHIGDARPDGSPSKDTFRVLASIEAPRTLPREIADQIRLMVGMRFQATVVTERKKVSSLIQEKVFGR